MTCHQAQTKLSLYLYGELTFAQEEELEKHLSECALCERALGREKTWHTALNGRHADVPLELLAQCRQQLDGAIAGEKASHGWYDFRSWRMATPFGFSGTRWSARLAIASFLVISGFTAARWLDRNGDAMSFQNAGLAEGSLINPSAVRIRDIQPGVSNGVRIVVDQLREQEVTGQADDQEVRQLLLAGAKDSADPGIRVDSVEMLKGQNGDDVRNALLHCARQDPNAAVRLKALEALRSFSGDPETREALKAVIEGDDNPGVRSEAINVLVPMHQKMEFSPDLAGTLQEIMRSGRDDDYVSTRCQQVLREMNAPLDVY